ncbi:MAG: hypothetical protein ABIR32_00845 [Ilumatobacteraceae bacterium]
MDPSSDLGAESGPGEWFDEPSDRLHGESAELAEVLLADAVQPEGVPAPPARRLKNIAIVAVLVGLLVSLNGNWSPARARPTQIEMVDAVQPVEVQIAVTSVAQVAAVGDPAATSTTSAASTSSVMVVVDSPPIDTTPGPTVATAPPAEPVPEPVSVAVPEVTDPALVSRPIPEETDVTTPPATSPWADKSRMTAAGYVATDVGCSSGTSASALDAFFSQRIGPVIGHDYQHVYPLGGSRYLWLFQDTFVDYSGNATSLGQATFDHNSAMVQDDSCFTLYHRGSITRPKSFENGTGESRLAKWFWPMGGQTFDGRLYVFWAEMTKDGYEPTAPNGLGWHPARTWLAVYDAQSLARLSFSAAPNSGVLPIYGYAVDSDAEYTYLFGNTFEQNLQREGGYTNGPHSGTKMFLARVPRGQFGAPLEYRTADGWAYDAAAAQPINSRYWAENPMQPRYLNGQWVAATKVNGYWGESLSIDVANDPWGPWSTTESRGISPRGGDPLMNTYHAHLMPWLDGGALVVSVSQNARNMLRDAWPAPQRYRLAFFKSAFVAPPPRAEVPVETSTTVAETSTTVAETSTTVVDASTTVVETSTTVVETSTTAAGTSTTSTTQPPTTTTSTTSTTTPDTTPKETTPSSAQGSTTTSSSDPAPSG